MLTSARSAFLHCSRTTSLTSRTAVYGPVRTVVWQGSAGDCRPYADQTGLSVTCRSMLSGLLGNERTVPVFPESETFKSVRVTAPSLPRILKGLTSML
jgi:hypothetical protein